LSAVAAARLAINPFGARSFLLIVSPLMTWSACVMLGSCCRSESAAVTRGGRPKAVRKYESTAASGNCNARRPG
jgi:hypothetical protein